MKPGVFREEYIAIIVRELLRGLDYLHTEGKLHRDIKGQLLSPRWFKHSYTTFLQLPISYYLLEVK